MGRPITEGHTLLERARELMESAPIDARGLLQRAAEEFREAGSDRGQADSLVELSVLALGDTNFPEARRLAEHAIALFEGARDPEGVGIASYWAGVAAASGDDEARALEAFERACPLLDRFDRFELLLEAREGLGGILYDRGRLADAEVEFELALDLTPQVPSSTAPARLRARLARVVARRGEIDRAVELLRVGLAHLGASRGGDVRKSEAMYRVDLADLLAGQGKLEEARRLYDAASKLYTMLGMTDRLDRIDAKRRALDD